MAWDIICGDALEVLRGLEDESVHCCVTSPPYWGLRDYGVDGQIGLEFTLDEYMTRVVAVFDEVRRVLRQDGTLWLNIGDVYNTHRGGPGPLSGEVGAQRDLARPVRGHALLHKGLKVKDMIGLPWRLAFALQDAGWWLRSDCIWHKPSPVPESCKDRPTRAHEYIFLLAKSQRYYYDHEAIKEPASPNTHSRGAGLNKKAVKASADAARAFGRRRSTVPIPRQNASFAMATLGHVEQRNARTVWKIASQPRGENHFAAYPDELARRCILAGCPPGGTVLDPFVGRGTTAIVALRLGRSATGIDISPEYCELARRNVVDDAPLLNTDGGTA